MGLHTTTLQPRVDRVGLPLAASTPLSTTHSLPRQVLQEAPTQKSRKPTQALLGWGPGDLREPPGVQDAAEGGESQAEGASNEQRSGRSPETSATGRGSAWAAQDPCCASALDGILPCRTQHMCDTCSSEGVLHYRTLPESGAELSGLSGFLKSW